MATLLMEADGARTVLEGMRVEGWPGVYVLGCIDRRVTVYSQQVRALNLAAALRATERVKPGDPVVIVGAGAAGLTCAAGLQRLGAEVVVLEAREQILPLFRGRSTRWLHPGVYDWPLEGWSRDRAGLPLMDWEHGLVDNVRVEMEAGWNRIVEQGKVSVRRGVSLVKLGAAGDAPRTVTWSPRSAQRTATVILAVGFGLEPTALPTEKGYWEGDDLDAARVDGKRRRWLVSGCGDGALTDLFRLCLEGFRHDQMLREHAQHPRMRGVRDEIRRIESDAAIQDDPVKLHDVYRHLDAPWVVEAMQKLPRPNTEVWLNAPTAEFLTRGASALNRFLAGQLYRAGRFDFVPGTVQNAVPDGDRVVVHFEDGTSETFDRVVRRHGPVSALTAQFPLIAKAIESERIHRRDKPTLTDQTRTRHWLDGIFGREVRDIPDPEAPKFKTVIVSTDAVGSWRESSSGRSLRPYEVQDWLRRHAADLNQRADRLRASPTWLNDPELVDVSVRERSIGEVGTGRLVRTFERALETAEPRIVIVGEGGAGKTTLLIGLAVAMSRRALEDERAPLPLYLRLNSFDAEQRSFYGLLDALELSSGLPKQALEAIWRDERPCCFLLDGLNEVHPDFMDGCLSAIEQLAPTNGRHRCIVTSRLTADVDELARRIAPSILETVPLTEPQIWTVLGRHGLAAVVDRLGPRLTELARTPFLLSAIVKICEEVDHAKVPLSVPQLIRTLIDDYIFERREMEKPRAVRPTTYDYKHVKRPILARVALPMVREGVTRIPEDPALLKTIRAQLHDLQAEYRGMLVVMPEEPHSTRFLDEVVLNDILTRSTSRKGKTLEFLNESVLDYYAGIELSSLTAADIAALVPPLVWRRIEDLNDELPVSAKFTEAIAMHVGLDGDASQLLPLVAARHPLVAARCVGTAGLHEIPAGRALLQEWAALLRDPRPLRRWVACQCLQRAGNIDEDAGQRLADLACSDPEPFVRLVAMHALSSCRREAPIAWLVAALVAYDGSSSSDPGNNLWRLRSSRAVRALVERWSAPATSKRDRARIESLLATMDPDFVDNVLARIEGPATEEARRALPGWNCLGYYLGFQASRRIREQERSRVVAEEAERRHRERLSGKTVEELQCLLREGSEDERGVALELLHARAALTVDRLFDMLRDPSARVRGRAEAALCRLPSAQWCTPWEARMSDAAWTELFHVPAELEEELFFELPDRWIREFASHGISARELGCSPVEPGWLLEPIGGSLEKDAYRVIRAGDHLSVIGASIRPRLAILGAQLGERAIPALDRFLTEDPRSARSAVVEAWGRIGTDAAIGRLAEQLRSEPLDWRVVAAIAASRRPAARKLLLDVLGATRVPDAGMDVDVENRVRALTNILIDLGATEELRRLISVMLDSSDAEQHVIAAHIVLAHGAKTEHPFEDLAIHACGDPDPRVRVAGMRMLATTQNAAAREILLRACMNESAGEVWSAACAAFRRACSDEDLRQLRQARHAPDRDTRARVIGALALVRDDSAIPDLLEALHDPDAEIHALAAEGLQRLGAPPPSMQRDPRHGDH